MQCLDNVLKIASLTCSCLQQEQEYCELKQTSEVAVEAATALLVLWIDHMNDLSGYSKKIKSFATQEGLTGVLHYRMKERAEDICLILQGSDDGITSFMAKMRTQYMDVNSKGLKCKERKMAVLFQGTAPSDVAQFEPLSSVQYGSVTELSAHLQELCPSLAWTQITSEVAVFKSTANVFTFTKGQSQRGECWTNKSNTL